MADPKYFKTDAKAIVDGFFDAKLFKEEITRDDMNNVEDFIAEMMQSKEAYFLEVCVEKEDNVFPMIPTGASVSDIRLE